MAFPIRDVNPTSRFPLVTKVLVIVNVLVFIFELLNPNIVDSLSLIPALVLSAEEPHRLFTHMFLHGGFMHILGNMWYLWIFGDNVEDALGRTRFAMFYFIWGIAAAATHTAVSYYQYQATGEEIYLTTPAIGASGAVSGVLGAYLALYPRARILTIIFVPFIALVELPAIAYIGFWFIYQLIYGTLDLYISTIVGVPRFGGVAYWAHIGGFVAGLLTGLAYRRRVEWRRKYWWEYYYF